MSKFSYSNAAKKYAAKKSDAPKPKMKPPRRPIRRTPHLNRME